MNKVFRFFKIENRQEDNFDVLVSTGLGLFGQGYYCHSARQK
jgi:hypothetical protein